MIDSAQTGTILDMILGTDSSPGPTPPITSIIPAVTAPPITPPIVESSSNPNEVIVGKYRVVIKRDKCIGAASCVAVAVRGFSLGDDQVVRILPTINQESIDTIIAAASSCPTLAIEVYDNETGASVWPR